MVVGTIKRRANNRKGDPMINRIRRQLTLFVDQKDAETIEEVRREFNPRQSQLIKCHVTLCREDEIENLEKVFANLSLFAPTEIVIEFGKVERFDNGKGLFIPTKNENYEFQNLRRQILSGIIDSPRKQEPHITLMHPRNSTCTEDIFEHIRKIEFPTQLAFKKVSLIEQEDAEPWRLLREFKLAAREFERPSR